MSLIELLFEKYKRKKDREATHPDGTYIAASLRVSDSVKLYKWVVDNNIPNLADKNQYHVTIIYSRKGIPAVKLYEFDTPIKGKIVGWHVFKTQTGKNCLVADIDSKSLTKIHEDIMSKYGATYDFKDYKPHVTVSYEYNSDKAPETFPKMDVVFDRVKVDPLDTEFTPKKA